jgi:hypothetical protein
MDFSPGLNHYWHPMLAMLLKTLDIKTEEKYIKATRGRFLYSAILIRSAYQRTNTLQSDIHQHLEQPSI